MDAVLRQLGGCKMRLPSSEIVEYVTKNFGHPANSIRTTLYDLKQKGQIVQEEQRGYHHLENCR